MIDGTAITSLRDRYKELPRAQLEARAFDLFERLCAVHYLISPLGCSGWDVIQAANLAGELLTELGALEGPKP